MKKFASIVTFSVLALSGCNHITKVGTLGNQDIYSVRSTDISGPNLAMFATVEHDTQEVVFFEGFAAGGVLPSAITAGGDIAASRARRPDNVDIGDRQYLRPNP